MAIKLCQFGNAEQLDLGIIRGNREVCKDDNRMEEKMLNKH